MEYFRIPRNVLVICLGKSTYARCGIIVNVTPLEPEWEGHITLEFSNTTPLPAKIYANEGVAQLFTLDLNGRKVIGTVGALQFEVIQYRLEHEYNAKCTYESINIHKACWVDPDDPKNAEFEEFKRVKQRYLARDKKGQLVFLADSAFTVQMTQDKYPSVKLRFVSEFD